MKSNGRWFILFALILGIYGLSVWWYSKFSLGETVSQKGLSFEKDPGPTAPAP